MQYLLHLNSMAAISNNLEGLDLQNLNDEFPELDLLNMELDPSAMDRPSPFISSMGEPGADGKNPSCMKWHYKPQLNSRGKPIRCNSGANALSKPMTDAVLADWHADKKRRSKKCTTF